MSRLLVLVLVAITAGIFAAQAQAFRCTPSSTWPVANRPLAQQVFGLVNQHRKALGLLPLKTTRTLRRVATWKARDMAGEHYFAHDDLFRSVWQRFWDCGFRGGYRGENIAFGFGTAYAVVAAWLNSPGHRANIESPFFRLTGVAVAADYFVQDFG
jgi:uncharacterized protein YkwD